MSEFSEETVQRYPLLRRVLTSFWQHRNEYLLDPIAALEEGAESADADGALIARELRQLVADEPDQKQLNQRLIALGMDDMWFLPGNTHAQCLLAARRLDGFSPRGRDFEDLQPVPLERATSWRSEEVAQRVVRRTLELYRGELELWTGQQNGLPRVWLSVDLGDDLGLVTEAADKSLVGSRTTCCTVVLKWGETRPDVRASYPDVVLEQQWRKALPTLPHVFGGYFGQHCLEEFVSEWDAFGAVLNWFDPPARGRVVDELAQLLTLSEPEAQVAVRNLGSYVVPPDTLGWLERLHWVLAETRERP